MGSGIRCFHRVSWPLLNWWLEPAVCRPHPFSATLQLDGVLLPSIWECHHLRGKPVPYSNVYTTLEIRLHRKWVTGSKSAPVPSRVRCQPFSWRQAVEIKIAGTSPQVYPGVEGTGRGRIEEVEFAHVLCLVSGDVHVAMLGRGGWKRRKEKGEKGKGKMLTPHHVWRVCG